MYPMLALHTTPKMHTAPAAGEPGTAGPGTAKLTEQRQHIVAAVVVRSTGFYKPNAKSVITCQSEKSTTLSHVSKRKSAPPADTIKHRRLNAEVSNDHGVPHKQETSPL